MNFKKIIQEIYKEVKSIDNKGQLASYIPELANVDSESFGVHITTIDQIQYGIGNCQDKFSIQSIAKVLALSLAYHKLGEHIWARLGVPGKSGVGGGIIAIHPNQYAIAVWSPKLNEKGNSYKGMRFLEEFTTKSQLSIF